MIPARKTLRQAARDAGERFYEDPHLCKRGHSLRYVSSGSCVQCGKLDGFTLWADAECIPPVQRAWAERAWNAAAARKPAVYPAAVLAALEKGRATAADLAEQVGANVVTVRNILKIFAEQGAARQYAIGRMRYWVLT